MSDANYSNKEHEILGSLIHEMIYQKYRVIRDEEKGFFGQISLTDYIALFQIVGDETPESVLTHRKYLSEISEQTGMTMRQTSRNIRAMKDKGLVSWRHDGNGEDGTYITITEHGLKIFQEAKTNVEKVYTKVMDQFGKDKFAELIDMLKELETILGTTLEEWED